MDHEESGPGPSRAPASRRQWPRIDLVEDLHGLIVALDLPVHVLEVGLGGFSMECDAAFPVGATQQVRFALRGVELVLPCRVAHCRRCDRGYVTGFQFAERPGDPDDADWRVKADRLIDLLTSSLSFE